jgi:hypothetical protein
VTLPPSIPVVPGELWRAKHPELSNVLTHFCGRGRPPGVDVPPEIRTMEPPDRLATILQDGFLRAFDAKSGGYPAVCFTEARHAGLDFMMRSRGYKPWGLMFDRGSVHRAGGGPVWHARDAEAAALRKLVDPIFRSWVVRLGVQPGERSDWLEEREWRIVLGSTSEPRSVVPLERLTLVGILIDDMQWTGARSGQMGLSVLPRWAADVPRYKWDRINRGLVRVQPPALTQPA